MRKLEAERRKSGGGRGGGGLTDEGESVQMRIQIERWFSDKCRIINLSLTYSYT